MRGKFEPVNSTKVVVLSYYVIIAGCAIYFGFATAVCWRLHQTSRNNNGLLDLEVDEPKALRSKTLAERRIDGTTKFRDFQIDLIRKMNAKANQCPKFTQRPFDPNRFFDIYRNCDMPVHSSKGLGDFLPTKEWTEISQYPDGAIEAETSPKHVCRLAAHGFAYGGLL